MATLVLAAAGAAIGNTLLPAGISVLGATVTGAAIGSQVGALAGSFVDQALFGASGQSRALAGPRLSDLRVTASTEGAPVPRVYGAARVGGQVIWATDFEEEAVTTEAGGGGKGGGSGGGATRTDFLYYANFAVALAEGELTGLGRVWADGQELDLATVTTRFYAGSETQAPDSLIAAHAGADAAPAYRGVAYVVFERMALASFGNRIPQLSFEVFRTIDGFRDLVRGVAVIPGAGEFAYATTGVTRPGPDGSQVGENVHTRQGGSDWTVALDQLEAALPAVGAASLIVSWFGTDLRAGQCQFRPGVERVDKPTTPLPWSVAGTSRATAHLVSEKDGRPAYGGTPSDNSVVEAIQDLKARGLAVTLTPFVLMDIADGNTLPDPYGGTAQAPYPWRGRISVHPAAGQPGSPDKTAAAATQISALVGTAAVGNFAISGTSVVYSGPAEWSYRRMILHYAHLAKAAGGVDGFVIGTELRGLTTARSAVSTYPFVAALIMLANDVKGVLGPGTKVTYAADWSEYFGHHPGDSTGDVHFHLDPLWSAPAIDAIGIDLYWPLADWREGFGHLDAAAGARAIHDLAYLKSNIAGGEGYDWYYASAADRAAQVRSPITDGLGKPWVFRFKDLKSWWLNAHHNRPGGIESPSPTGWVAQSKPVWLMELGCPAVDMGANQPNVFVDPKSAESALPHFSRGVRDDLIQRRYLQAFLEALDPAHPGAIAGANPLSTVYGGRMIDLARIHVYAWDARPFPAFPFNSEAWGDAPNWRLGHWLNGRVIGIGLAECVAGILGDWGFADFDASALDGIVPGYVVERMMSAREALQPLELGYFFDAVESGGLIAFRPRGAAPPRASFTPEAVVETRPEAGLVTLTRGQETELPASVKLTYVAASQDYRQAVAEARRLAGASGRIAEGQLAVALDEEQAVAKAETWLHEAWSARERASFAVTPSQLALEPGDVVTLTSGGRSRQLRITEITDRGAREIEARSIDAQLYAPVAGPTRDGAIPDAAQVGMPALELLDLPLLTGEEPAHAGYAAAAQVPWPGGVALYRSPATTGFTLKALCAKPAMLGTTLDPLPAGPTGRIDRASRIRVLLDSGTLASVERLKLLEGGNAAALRNEAGAWEVIQFETATLMAERTYEISGLLRGQAGSEGAMQALLPAGARFVLLGTGLTRVEMVESDVGLPFRWRYGPANRDLGHASYQERVHAFAGQGLKPLSPVHVRGLRDGAGNLAITWIRRTRIGGDSWEAIEVPLDNPERYEIDILDGATVKRTIPATTVAATYTAAEQTADFGAPQPSISLRVVMTSPVAGRGTPRTALL